MQRRAITISIATAALIAGCSASAPQGSPSSSSSPSASDSAAATPQSLSSVLACPDALTVGKADPGGHPGATVYPCENYTMPNDPSNPANRYAYIVFFTDKGSEETYARDGAKDVGPGGQRQVVGPGWVVWGNDLTIINAAINQGGTES